MPVLDQGLVVCLYWTRAWWCACTGPGLGGVPVLDQGLVVCLYWTRGGVPVLDQGGVPVLDQG